MNKGNPMNTTKFQFVNKGIHCHFISEFLTSFNILVTVFGMPMQYTDIGNKYSGKST